MKHTLNTCSRRSLHRCLRSERGFTIAEMMIVLLLLGLALGIAIPSFNTLTHAKLRESSTKLAGTIRYLYSQAALKGLCMRLVINLKKHSYHVEASTDGQCMVDDRQISARQAKQKEEKKQRKAKEPPKTTSNNPDGSVSLELKKTQFTQYNKGLLRGRILPGEVRIKGVYTIRQKGVFNAKSGPSVVTINCFPLGQCERAVIFLKDSTGEIFSLEVKPLTGRVVIHRKEIKLKDYHKNPKKGEDDAF